MILRLRQCHRRVFAVLGVLLPLAFAFGIGARRPVPEMETLPPELAPRTQTFSAITDERDDLFDDSPVRVRLWRQQETGSLAVSFTSDETFLKPDLLAYWSDTQLAKSDPLPPKATLLGAFVAGPLLLPKGVTNSGGSLILYSVARSEIVDVSKRTRFADSAK